MRNYFVFIILAFAIVSIVPAQQRNRDAAVKLFKDGNFVEAKPIFSELWRRNPKDGSLTFWYAVCAYETTDTTVNVEEMLQYALTRKVAAANRYLGDYYKNLFFFDEAIGNYEDFLAKNKDAELQLIYDKRLEETKRLSRMMKMTEQITVIDSFVVDKRNFLSAYKTGRDIGKLQMADDYLKSSDIFGTVFETERLTDFYFPQQINAGGEAKIKIFQKTKVGGNWNAGSRIDGFDTQGNDNFPFMSADGTTFYFASDGEGSIGGYDIFVTRYNTETGRYLLPENIGMPFNSEANDYLLVINDVANLGWFATDRRMPEGKVCVYVFVPNSTKVTYNYENQPPQRMRALSQLTSILDTQDDEELLRKSRQQLMMLLYQQQSQAKKVDFTFVVDDLTNYNSLTDFKSDEARSLYGQLQKRREQYAKDSLQLEESRVAYSKANAETKNKMRDDLLKTEQRIEKEQQELLNLEINARNEEIKKIKR